MSGSIAMVHSEQEVLQSTWQEFQGAFRRKLEVIRKLLRDMGPGATTVGPHNAADEISACTWKIHCTARLIWSGNLLRDDTWVSGMNMTRRCRKQVWSPYERPDWVLIDHNHQVIKHVTQIWPLTWRASKQMKRQHCPALGAGVDFWVLAANVRVFILEAVMKGPSICSLWNIRISWQGTLMYNLNVFRV